MKLLLLVLSIPVAAVALYNARLEYEKHRKLTVFGLLLVCLMLFVPNVLIDYATSYTMPETAIGYAGVALAIAGLALCITGIIAFRSLSKVMCLDAGSLAESGPYRWGRNPQYVGWVMFLAGFCLTDWSWWCLAALVVVSISLHVLVLIEEEHLCRVFGERYVEFFRRTPRYVGWGHGDSGRP